MPLRCGSPLRDSALLVALQLLHQSPLFLLLVMVQEVLFPFLTIGLTAAEHVIVDHQDAVGYRHRSSLRPLSSADAPRNCAPKYVLVLPAA
jgi:hypothetical protein